MARIDIFANSWSPSFASSLAGAAAGAAMILAAIRLRGWRRRLSFLPAPAPCRGVFHARHQDADLPIGNVR